MVLSCADGCERSLRREGSDIQLGFGLTQRCNLRCPHCIRDEVHAARSLSVALVRSVVDQAVALFPDLGVSFSGGEPLLHPQFAAIVELLRERGLPYRFVSNGWHMTRALPALMRHPPQFVRLSLSGGSEAVHDAERGRGSFRRVLHAAMLLTASRIPTSLSLVVDRRSRHELAAAAELADALGCMDLHVILPQPTPASASRASDLAAAEWPRVRREVEALARRSGQRARLVFDYGMPFDDVEELCDTKRLHRPYVDAAGRLALCCQLSEYGENAAEVVADLALVPLADAWAEYGKRLDRLHPSVQPRADGDPALERLPCFRCARALRKLDWCADDRGCAWHSPV